MASIHLLATIQDAQIGDGVKTSDRLSKSTDFLIIVAPVSSWDGFDSRGLLCPQCRCVESKRNEQT